MSPQVGTRSPSFKPQRQSAPGASAATDPKLARVYVMLATDEVSYVSAARIALTGGKPII